MRLHDRMGAEIVAAAFGSDEQPRSSRRTTRGSAARRTRPPGREHPAPRRILSICDAYDAMVTDRVYRKGRSPEEAFASAPLRRQAVRPTARRAVRVGGDAARPRRRGGGLPLGGRRGGGPGPRAGRAAGAGGAQDMSMLSAMASRLAATAGRDGLGEVAQVATALEQCLAPPGRAGRREQGERADGTGEIRRAWHQRPRPAAP